LVEEFHSFLSLMNPGERGWANGFRCSFADAVRKRAARLANLGALNETPSEDRGDASPEPSHSARSPIENAQGVNSSQEQRGSAGARMAARRLAALMKKARRRRHCCRRLRSFLEFEPGAQPVFRTTPG
jgi:hypothetical protein